jgi:transposase
MARAGREVWAKRVERWRESGLSAKEYAAEVGINANTLTHWGWRLRGEGGRPKKERRRTEGEPSRVDWVEVVAPDSVMKSPATELEDAPAARPGRWLELVVGRGRVIRVPTDFDRDALDRLLAVVEAR